MDQIMPDSPKHKSSAVPEKKTHPHKHQNHEKSLLHYKRLGRELAMQYLFETDLMGTSDAATMEDFWSQAEDSGEFPTNRIFRKARNYAEKLIQLVQEHDLDVTEELEQLSQKWDIDRMSAVDRNILKIAICEMMFCPDIPHLVSIDEAIEISKDFSDDKSGNFINGILNALMKSLPPEQNNNKKQRN